jgi:hypothetical protein
VILTSLRFSLPKDTIKKMKRQILKLKNIHNIKEIP